MKLIVKFETFPYEIFVFFGSKKKLLKNLNMYLDSKTINEINKESFGLGKSILLKDKKIILYMNKIPESAEDFSILQHEIFHCIHYLLEVNLKLKLSFKTDEIYAYLIQNLTKQIYNKLNEYRK